MCCFERIHGDICGPIHPPCGPFRFFLALINAFGKWTHVSLLSSRNLAFPRILAQIIQLRSSYPNNPIQSLRMDNATEFKSRAFDSYCESVRIKLEYSVSYVHTQNGLAESFIKRL